jgi:peptidoglycan/LPS O-acetylase OafA/YrhL
LLSAAYGSPGLDRMLASKPLQRLGDWSFSIYLIHQPFLYQAVALLHNPDKTGIVVPPMGMLISWASCLLFVAFILFVSYLSYRFIEVPARNFINDRRDRQKRPSISTIN